MHRQDYDSINTAESDDGPGLPHRAKQSREKKTPPRSSRGSESFVSSLTSFWIEALCFLLSLGSFGAIIGLLSAWQNQPVTRWALPIPLNAIISILSAVFKASLVMPISEGISQLKWIWFATGTRPLSDVESFDRASRGPWGSLRFLAGRFTRARAAGSRGMAAGLGAVIILAAIATDPFSQALIQFYSCPQPSASDRAGVPRTSTFDQTVREGTTLGVPNRTLWVAAYQGLIDPPSNSSSSLSGQIRCPTGNCDFPTAPDGASFSTLGMCSYCADISNQSRRLGTGTNISYALDVGAQRSSLQVVRRSPLETGARGSFEETRITPGTVVLNFTALMMLPDGGCGNTPSSANFSDLACQTKPLAVGCDLRFCVQTYSASVNGGVYAERLVKTEDLRALNISEPTAADPAALLVSSHTLRNGTWEACTSSHGGLDAATATLINDTRGFPEDCVWSATGRATYGVAILLKNYFELRTQFVLDRGLTNSSSGELWLHRLWNDGAATLATVSEFADGFVRAVSAEMRKSGGGVGDMRYASGRVLNTDTCIAVQWPWLAFLVGLLVMEVGFAVAVIVASCAGGWRGDWKSSALAMLASGADDGARRGMTASGHGVNSLYHSATSVLVRLERDGAGWRFVSRQGRSEESIGS